MNRSTHCIIPWLLIQAVAPPSRTAALVLVLALGCTTNPAGPIVDSGPSEATLADAGVADFAAGDAGDAGVDVVTEPTFAVAGQPYVRVFRASFPTMDLAPDHFRLIKGPSLSTLSNDGVFSWLPPESSDARSIEVTVEASNGVQTAQQTIILQLLSVREVGRANVSSVGGRIEVLGSGTQLDGLVVIVPENKTPDLPSEEVRVLALSGGNLRLSGFVSIAPPLLITGTTRRPRLEISAVLRARLQRGGEAANPLAIVAYAPPAQAGYEPVNTRIVAGSCCSDKQIPGGALAREVASDAIVQILENQGTCYCLEQPPFRIRYWASPKDNDASAAQASLLFVASAAQQAKAALEGAGCTPLGDDDLDIYIYPLPSTNPWGIGATEPGGQSVLLNRDRYESIGQRNTDEQRLLRTVVHHELTHVFHDRMVGIDGVTIDMADGAWSVEGLAVFNEDEIEDTNQYLATFPWQTFGSFVANGGLREGIRRNRLHPYVQSAFFKALKATAGFKTCTYLKARQRAASAYEALDSLLGGTEVRHDQYADFVATWLLPELWPLPGRIDDDGLIPDTVVSANSLARHTLPATGAQDYALGLSAGGIGAKFVGGTATQTITVTLVEPDKDARGLVFDDRGQQVAKLEAGKPAPLPSGTTTFLVAIAIDQGPASEGLGLLHNVRVRIETESPAGPCPDGTQPTVGPWHYRSFFGTRTTSCDPPYGDYYKIYDDEQEAIDQTTAGYMCTLYRGCSGPTSPSKDSWTVSSPNDVKYGFNTSERLVYHFTVVCPDSRGTVAASDTMARWRTVECK